MKTYKTSEVAAAIGIHPNTVRLYEEWGLIPGPAGKRTIPCFYRFSYPANSTCPYRISN